MIYCLLLPSTALAGHNDEPRGPRAAAVGARTAAVGEINFAYFGCRGRWPGGPGLGAGRGTENTRHQYTGIVIA